MRSILAALILAMLALTGTASATAWDWTSNWGGIVDHGQITRAGGDFTIPATTGYCGATSRAPVWVGIGENTTLAQLGFTLTPAGTGAWFEVIDANNGGYEQDVPFPVATGDHVKIGLSFTPDHSTLTFRWADITTGRSLYRYVTGAARYWSASTADWIVERMAGWPLANFYPVRWTTAWYGTPTAAWPLQPAAVAYNMTGTYTYATTTLPADPESATTNWRHC